MKIKNKIVLGFVIFIVLVLLLGIGSIFYINSQTGQALHNVTNNIHKLNKNSHLDSLAQFIRYYDEVLTQSARNYALTQNTKWKIRYKDAEPKLDHIIKDAISLGDKQDKSFFTSVDKANIALIAMEYRSIELVDNGHNKEAVKILESKEYWNEKDLYEQGLRKYIARRKGLYDDALIGSTNIIESTIKVDQELINQTILITLFLIISSIILSFIIFLIIIQKIFKPIKRLKKAVEGIGKSNLNTEFEINTKDEIGDLAASFRQMTEELKVSIQTENELSIKIATSILELEKAEEWNRTFDSISDFITILDTDLNILRANKSFCNAFKTDNKSIMGKKCHEIIHKSESPWPDCPAVKTLQTRKSQTTEIIDENIGFPLLVSTFPIFDKKGLLTGVVHIAKDITELKYTEELTLSHKMEAIGQLAGGIAHDFNNLLTVILGNIYLTKQTLSKNHPGFNYLEQSEQSMDRAVHLTGQLLTFAKGGGPIKENIRLEQVIESISRFNLSGSNVMLVFEQTNDLWSAEVDKGQIEQVFSNLIINAKQAMPDGGTLYINLENAYISESVISGINKGKYIKVTLRDEGTGIEQKYINKIFDPFFTTKPSGNGLGLTTTYSIVNKHNGYINIDTKLGRGTTFTIYLPATEQQHQEDTKQPEAVKDFGIQQTQRILVMDDEELVCNMVNEMLKMYGFSVSSASDGKQAIEMYKQSLDDGNPYDLIIMDLTIPGGMGGKEAVKEFLNINIEVKCIVSSGYANDPVLQNYAEYGFKGILNKPYTINELQKVLIMVLEE